MTPFAHTKILGIPIHLPRFRDAVAWAEAEIRAGRGGYICHVGAHGLVEAQGDLVLQRALSGADLAAADGMPLVWLGRRVVPGAERVYGPDFMRAVLAATETWTDRPCRHFLFGSTPTVLDALTRRIRAEYPGAVIVGSVSPPFRTVDAEEESEHLNIIRTSGADVVWVGLGAPRQEKWMARMTGRLPGVLLVGVGAAFDFLAGEKVQAPVWIQRAGLEWAFRWAAEPRRLTRRYLHIVPGFLLLLARDALRRSGKNGAV